MAIFCTQLCDICWRGEVIAQKNSLEPFKRKLRQVIPDFVLETAYWIAFSFRVDKQPKVYVGKFFEIREVLSRSDQCSSRIEVLLELFLSLAPFLGIFQFA